MKQPPEQTCAKAACAPCVPTCLDWLRERDEFAGERRAVIIEALSWHEDSEGRWGYERAADVLAAHESEWCGIDVAARVAEAVEEASD